MPEYLQEGGSSEILKDALIIKGLEFAYPRELPVLKGFDLTVRAGEKVALIGANGSGKTTLLGLSCGLFSPNAGSIELFGSPVRQGGFIEQAGLLLQNPDDQLFCPSVREDIQFGPKNMNLSAGEVSSAVRKAMELTGTVALAERAPHHLSAGEKRMVALAAVLSMEPIMLLCDEPASGLDHRARRKLIQFLISTSMTLMIASHDMELLLEVCDRAVILDAGGVAADGSPHDILGNTELMNSHGLEKPHSLIPHAEPHHQG